MNITLTLDKDSAFLITMAMADSAHELIACGDEGLAERVTELAQVISKEIQRQLVEAE
jgi:hypothetical protein